MEDIEIIESDGRCENDSIDFDELVPCIAISESIELMDFCLSVSAAWFL